MKVLPEKTDRAARWADCLPRILQAVSLAAYLPAAAWLAWLSRDQINPDGVAYIQVARHWAAGRLDLAVNSWWGPLLSWLLVPAIRLGWEPVVAVKILGAMLGLLTAVGAGRIARLLVECRPGIGAACRLKPFDGVAATGAGLAPSICFAAMLGLALTMLPEPVTPDLLLACILTWYFAVTLAWLCEGGTRHMLAAGALGGLAYLAKSYGLPFVVLHLATAVWMRRRFVRKTCDGRHATTAQWLRPALHALAVLALVAGPWVIAVSRYAGKPTIGCAGEYARRAFDPVALQTYDLPIFDLQVPRQGRLTCWENGLEIPRQWPNWPVAGIEGLRRLATDVALNVWRVVCFVSLPDKAPLMWLSAAVLVAAWLSGLLRGPMLWGVLSGMLFYAGYLPLVIYDRFLWPCRPLQIAVMCALLFSARPAAGDASLEGNPAASARQAWYRAASHRVFAGGRLTGALVAAILAAAVWAGAATLYAWSGPDGQGANYSAIRMAGELAGRRKATFLASNEWHRGLFAAYWGNVRHLGQTRGRSAEEVAAELAPFGSVCLLVFDDEPLSKALSESKLFRKGDRVDGQGDIQSFQTCLQEPGEDRGHPGIRHAWNDE